MYICKKDHKPIMYDIYAEPIIGEIKECPLCKLLDILKQVKERNMEVLESIGYIKT